MDTEYDPLEKLDKEHPRDDPEDNLFLISVEDYYDLLMEQQEQM